MVTCRPVDDARTGTCLSGHRHAGLWRLLHVFGEKAEAILWLSGDASNTKTSSMVEPVVLVITNQQIMAVVSF